MAEVTKYWFMVRCTNCFHIQEKEGNRCSQCGYLFIGQADEQEIKLAKSRIFQLKQRANSL